MNKLFYTSALCAFSLFLGSTVSKANDFPTHYRTLPVQVELTKQTKSFDVKNIFPYKFPDDLPGKPVFIGVKGQFSTTTQATFDENGKENTSSETLFAVDYTSNKCATAGEAVSSYADLASKYDRHPLLGNIVKQTVGGKTITSDVDYMLSYGQGIPVATGKEGCGIVVLDGTDFKGNPYTMKVDLRLKYTFEPVTNGLDGEFIISTNNIKTPALNAYVVLPVASGSGKGASVLRPGTIFAVNGNVSTMSGNSEAKGNWDVRYITAVYKNNSCQAAFKNHSATKFYWNSSTGVGSDPNPSSIFGPDVTIISDFIVSGKGRETVMRQPENIKNLPIHVEDGDCVAQVGLPYGVGFSNNGSQNSADVNVMNMESQVYIRSIPD